MCRFLLFKGEKPVLLADLLTRPAHSIINQAFSARLRLDDTRPINGDGFGVGWYQQDASEGDQEVGDPDPSFLYFKDHHQDASPCTFTSTLPAWNNPNLYRLCEKIKSQLVFAHVRAATIGSVVSEANCHPWYYGRLMWMHNGNINQFIKIKKRVIRELKDDLFEHVQGNTDSEYAFAVFLNQLKNPLNNSFTHQELSEAMLITIQLFNKWLKEANIEEGSMMNFAVTDGKSVVCTRYINSLNGLAPSLFYSSGTQFELKQPGIYQMTKSHRRQHLVVVASEPLTFERKDWLKVPQNTMLVITDKMNVHVSPIMDEYYDHSESL